MEKIFDSIKSKLPIITIIILVLPLCMCADYTDTVKKMDSFVTAHIFTMGRNQEVLPPDPENTGPSCSCGKKFKESAFMTMSASDGSEENGFNASSVLTDSLIKEKNVKAKYRPGEVIVKFRNGGMALRSYNSIKQKGFPNSKTIISGKKSSITRKVILDKAMTVEKAMAELSKDPDVEYVQPNYIYRASAIPDDYEFTSQWGLRNTGQTVDERTGTAGYDINASAAWDTATNCSNVIVAVLDSGVNYTHRDLADNMWDGAACVDEGGNPMGGCLHGYDFVEKDKDPRDMLGHGTHVAGIIGARGNDGNRITGVCWNARIMAVRVLDVSGEGTTADIVSGIQFAINNGAKVINASWGDTEYDQVLYDAIKEARDDGVLFIASAGNNQSDNDTYPHYPSSFDLENIISVGAMDQDGLLAYFSCYGPTTVDIVAPGANILSDYPAQIVDTPEYFSTWHRGPGWEYEVIWSSIPGGYWGYYGELINYDTHNNTNSHAYRVFDLTVNNPDYITLMHSRWKYYLQDGVNFVHLVYDTDGHRPDNILGTMSKDVYFYAYDLTPYATSNTSIGFKFVTTTVIPNEGLTISPFVISRWYYYNNATACLYQEGTSMAAPFVSGAAALVWAANPGLTYNQVKSKLLNGARVNANLDNKIAGNRMLDVAGALSAAP